MRILSKRETVILSVTAGVVLFSVLFNTVLLPVLRKNEILDKKIALSRGKLANYRRLLSQKEKIRNEYSRFFSGAQGQGKTGDASVAALYTLENLAKEANVRIVEIRPRGGPEEGGSEKNTLFFMRLEGPLEGYVKFMYELENPLSLIRIKSFQVNARPNAQLLEGSLIVAGEDIK
jgi:hypothetical protein